ncbi:MAG TPA: hypothetical protein VGG28_04060 [Kofleriaceae bacterium]|jgi:hypothetical protein
MLPEARTVRDRLVAPPDSDETKFEAELAVLRADERRRTIFASIFGSLIVLAAAALVASIGFGRFGDAPASFHMAETLRTILIAAALVLGGGLFGRLAYTAWRRRMNA